MEIMNFYLDEIDRVSWNHTETSMSLASYLIRHPEIISKTAKFQEVEFSIIITRKTGDHKRVDIVFEDDSNIYFVECENKIYRNESALIEGMKIKLEMCKISFLNEYEGNKKIQLILAIISKRRL